MKEPVHRDQRRWQTWETCYPRCREMVGEWDSGGHILHMIIGRTLCARSLRLLLGDESALTLQDYRFMGKLRACADGMGKNGRAQRGFPTLVVREIA